MKTKDYLQLFEISCKYHKSEKKLIIYCNKNGNNNEDKIDFSVRKIRESGLSLSKYDEIIFRRQEVKK